MFDKSDKSLFDKSDMFDKSDKSDMFDKSDKSDMFDKSDKSLFDKSFNFVFIIINTIYFFY